jgi:hypothetical protein
MQQRRFNGILADLRKHGELVERETHVFNIYEAQKQRQELRAWRQEDLARIDREEKHQMVAQAQAVRTWLKYDDEQVEILDEISSQCFPGTCEWVLRNNEITSWLRNQNDKLLLMLVGKPGSGNQSVYTDENVLITLRQKHYHVEARSICAYTR